MKKIKYLILFLFLFIMSSNVTYGQLRDRDSVAYNAVINADIFAMQQYSGGAYLWKKMSWWALANGVKARIEGLPLTWANIQTFNGATFSAGSNGSVTVNDSLRLEHSAYTKHIFPKSAGGYVLGWKTVPWYKVYANEFKLINNSAGTDSTYQDSAKVYYDSTLSKIVFDKKVSSIGLEIFNAEGNDSASFDLDDSLVTLSKELSVSSLKVTSEFVVPDSTTFQGIALSGYEHAFTATTDSVLTITTMQSSVIFRSFSLSVTGLETINLTGAGNEQLLTLSNRVDYTVVLEDSADATGNMNLSGNFSMGNGDIITLKYDSKISVWVEKSRSDN